MRRTTATVTALCALLVGGCSSGSESDATPEPDGDTVTASSDPAPSTSSTPTDETTSASPSIDNSGPPRVVKTIATGLAAPWGVAFLPNGDAIVTERDTRRVLRLRAPSYAVRQVGLISAAVPLGDQGGEAGLLGVAVSPDFTTDHLLYFYLSTAADNRIVKARLTGNRLGAAQHTSSSRVRTVDRAISPSRSQSHAGLRRSACNAREILIGASSATARRSPRWLTASHPDRSAWARSHLKRPRTCHLASRILSWATQWQPERRVSRSA